MTGIDFRRLREAINMSEVLELLGFVALARNGNQVRGRCPVHEAHSAKSRSFSANLARNVYRCFHCGAAGNHLDLWAAATKQQLYEAALDLCAKLQREIPWLEAEQRRGTRITQRIRAIR
jgi:DNA primase